MAEMRASMAGTIFKVLVQKDDQVQTGQDVIVLESMKMEIPLQAETSGTVSQVHVEEGQFVNEGDPLLIID